MKKQLLLIFITLLSIKAFGQTYRLSGRITDPQDHPIGFASVYIKNTTYGTSANEAGFYAFNLKPGTYNVVYRFVGYKERTEKVTVNQAEERRDIKMVADSFLLKTVNVKSRRGDVAKDIMQQAIDKREVYEKQVKEYSAAVYIKGVQKLVESPKKLLGRDVAKVLDLDSSGKGILYQSESLSEYNYKDGKVKERMIASKVAGQNTAFSFNKASDLEVNFYKNLFEVTGLSARGFVSPVASNAMSFYNYKLLGSTSESGKTIHKIQLLPKRKHDPVFRGVIYIMEGDWRIYGTDLLITKDAMINLVDTLEISQQYVPVSDSIWMPASTQYAFKGDVLGFKFDGYYAAVYNNYNLQPNFPEGHFNGEIMRIDTAANKKDDAYWALTRPVPLTTQENRDYIKKDSTMKIRQSLPYLDSLERADNQLSPFNFTVTGYQYSNRKSGKVVYVYPFYTSIYYNTVEGWGVMPRVKFSKTLKDGSSYAITPALRYGFGNKMFNANVNFAYNYDVPNQGAFFAAFGGDILDLSDVGTRSLTFNTISSLISENNFVKYYRSRYAKLGFQREVKNGVLLNTELSYARRDQLYNTSGNHIFDNKDKEYTSNNPLTPLAESPLFPSHDALTFKASVLFTFNQEYVTRPTGRVYEAPEWPRLKVNYRKGMKGADYDFGSAELYDDKVSVGLLGYTAYKFSAGHFFNAKQVYFMDFNHFQGNQGSVFDPTIGSFRYLGFYDHSTDGRFFEGHVEHNFTGYFFNKVPGLRKLKLEEMIGVNYLAAHNTTNYYEAYFGIKRLFLRFDYGVAIDANKKVNQGFRIFYGLR
ncbi:DUF5686 and carboxypeptidase regulatory-like domain-containing protein [Mucilaginibacter myungsuensis]|uniref:Carboxypeptidase-like regulatory domain-containing protein n=1 Tax=Mucilaginibacter myungsuensis TaxID=649104 RepID=A0A929KTX9_9SPHI|nr:DUF5686 and carboxypeptidase regulatory-like domain-containing protein [Mucilaginibacter myungsuensis]MBE9661122.1 carboxypeptidase-like regulatory domain-containing protein [Mucilaginibacter myungsuensis]MDN3597267.1 DUF5686 and carboxypeptidase regulatory-like domain-containing protein [Mucilaginibacter myungsuensis]